jgi:uncharacterized membrane protein YebE (DUF533 family)
VRRLTITPQACVEALAVLVAFAWADARLDDREKASVRAAAQVLNLTKEHREKLESMLDKPSTIESVKAERLSPRDRAFAYVAAVWMCGVDEDVSAKEEGMLYRLADMLEIDDARKAELEGIARAVGPHPAGGRQWGDEIVRLFKAIPARLEQPTGDLEEIEVTFE